MKVVRLVGRGLAVVVVAVLLLDTFGGYLMEGPLGPIPGGAFKGDVSTDPDWSAVEEVIELEIRPEKPWSLSIWCSVVDGELYVPSGHGITELGARRIAPPAGGSRGTTGQ